jgi:(4S)-4-hydroxy-5-phosphonooxypentane-2,3-dione isomerase
MYWQVFRIDTQPGRRGDLLRLSQAYVAECEREDPGTLSFTFFLDEQDEDCYYAIEQYADRAAQQAHAQGAVIQRWAPEIVPLLAGAPVPLASGDQVELSTLGSATP